MINNNSSGTPTHKAGGRLHRKTAVELVEAELRSRIMSGALVPGTPLRQEALSEELGVSRIPLREAIRLLSFEGLVDLIPHKGAYVTMVSIGEVRELFELRIRLEPWLLEEACPLLSEADLNQAERIAGSMNNIDEQSWGQLNWELHGLLYRAAQRPMAMNMVRSLHEKTERYLRFQVVNTPIRQQAYDEHLALISLCRNRQSESAKQVLTQHIADAAQQIQDVVARLLDTTAPAKTS